MDVGSVPASVAIGDFNGDGKQDLAIANANSNTVSIRLWDGVGGFSGSTEVSVGSGPISVAIGDFNGDGKQDLAVANQNSNTVSIRLGDGMGGFSGSTEVSVRSHPLSVAIGDFNGDGKQDLAVANENFQTVSIRLGDGMGGFSGSTEVLVDSAPYSVAIGDFNGDGKQDLAIAHGSPYFGTVSIRLGDGLGGFSGSTEVLVDSAPYSVAIGDFNGDGKQDLAVANVGSGTVSIRLGDGLGGFSGSTEVSVGSGPQSVAIGDFNGDGKQDLATANAYSDTVSIRLGDGVGGFSGSTEVSVGSVPNSVAIGDFNGDGKQDLATANAGSNTVSILLGVCLDTYTVTYDGNGNTGGTAPVDPNQYLQGATVSVLDQGTLVRTGYTFANWNTAVNGSGTSYNPNDTFAMPGGNVTLYAQWMTVNPVNQTITVTTSAPSSADYHSQFTVAATATSGLPVTYSSSGVCTNSGSTFTMTSGTGTCTVKYDQAGDGNYNPAPQVTESVTVEKASQTISFTLQSSAPKSAGSLALTGSASSDLTVSYASSTPSVAIVSGSALNIVAAGTTTVTASQAGNSNYDSAADVDETIHITGPIAGADTASRIANSYSMKIPIADLLANDVRIATDGTSHSDNLSLLSVTSGSGNTVSICSVFVCYTPDDPESSGPLSFTYSVKDLADGTSTDVGTVTVNTESAQPFTLDIIAIPSPPSYDGTNTSATIDFVSVPNQSLTFEVLNRSQHLDSIGRNDQHRQWFLCRHDHGGGQSRNRMEQRALFPGNPAMIMHHHREQGHRHSPKWIGLLLAFFAFATSASAELIVDYNFTTNASIPDGSGQVHNQPYPWGTVQFFERHHEYEPHISDAE